MATIYGEVDSLDSLLSLFKKEGISFLLSLNDIISFKHNYETKIEVIKREVENELNLEIEKMKQNVLTMNKDYDKKIEDRERLLIEERDQISKEIEEIVVKPKNIISKLFYFVKLHWLNKRKDLLFKHLKVVAKRPFESLWKKISDETKSIDDLEVNRDSEISRRVDLKASILKKAKVVLDENHNLFLGAIGEQKAVDELKKLPDSYTVIKNFQLKMDRPIYNKNTRQRIYSIQADHIVIGPSGVFLIETKNWSQDSISKIDIYSPVDQIKRSSFALFCHLNNSVNNGFLPLFKIHWGDRKISIHNIILMVNAKPSNEFQYVKILGLHEICGYITYFKPIFNDEEIRQILNILR
jgi:hypothetical protein